MPEDDTIPNLELQPSDSPQDAYYKHVLSMNKPKKMVLLMLGIVALMSVIMLPMAIIGYLDHPKFLMVPSAGGKGLWKVEFTTGETQFCDAKTDANGQPVEGQCISVTGGIPDPKPH